MHDFILLRMAHNVVIDVIGLGSAGSYAEALANRVEGKGDEPAANWVTVGVCYPSKDIKAIEAPVEKVGYDFGVTVLPTLILQCRIDDYSKRFLANSGWAENLDWGPVTADWPVDHLRHSFNDNGFIDSPAFDDYPSVVDEGAGLSDAPAE